MTLTAHLDEAERGRVDARLRSNLMAWLTTVDPSGRPSSVPVWFVRRTDRTLLTYSEPGKRKLANLATNPHVADYLAKYTERIAVLFGTPERFADQFSVPIVITARRLLTGP